jgi:hypothetical protein
MSTDNYQVTVYLPPELLEYIEDYCKYKSILRKKDSKPILATGIVELLKLVAMSPVEELPTTLPDTLPDIDELIDRKLAEKKLVSKISDSAFITRLSDSKVIHTLLDTLLEDEELKTKLQQGLLENVPSTLLVSSADSENSEEITDKEEDTPIANDKGTNKTELENEGKLKADTTSEQHEDNKTTHGGNRDNDTSKEKTFDDTIATIKILKSESKTNGEIVKVLNNHGYPTLKGSRGKWQSIQVKRILEKHQEK